MLLPSFLRVRGLFRSIRSHLPIHKILTILLIFCLSGTPVFAVPETPKVILVSIDEFGIDVRYALNGFGMNFTLFDELKNLATRLNGKQYPLERLEIQPTDADGSLTILQGETVNFSAIGYRGGQTVQGLKIQWTVSNADGTRSRPLNNGMFAPQRAGSYTVTASSEGIQSSVRVEVNRNEGIGIQRLLNRPESERSDHDRENIESMRTRGILTSRAIDSRGYYNPSTERQRALADAEKRETIRQRQHEERQRRAQPSGRQTSENTNEPQSSEDGDGSTGARRRGGPRFEEAPATNPAAAPRLMDVVGWDDNNWWTAEDATNFVGSPPGSAPDAGASNGNFRMSAPVLSLSGRGLDVNLALVYNSRLWSKSGNTMTYDADDGFPAPGWSIGFGKMIYTGANGGCMLVTADGTRRSFSGDNNVTGSGTYYSNNFTGNTNDGSFIDYGCYYQNTTGGASLSGSAKLANGTTIVYSSPTGDKKQVFPTKITDSQGNYITITYVNNAGPRINTITDTLGRVITFNYSSNRLINITGPGYNGATRTFVRLTYAQKTLSYAFASPVTAATPPTTTPYLIDAIYYPDTNMGYWFGDSDSYSSYGMIAKVKSQRGLSWSGTGQGTVSQNGNTYTNRTEVYDFPMTADSSLTDSPPYDTHTETWDRMDTDIMDPDSAVTTYAISSNSGTETITITRPDGTRNRQTSVVNPSNWNDGLFIENEVLPPTGTDVLAKTKIYLAQGNYGSSRPTKIETTDELEQKTTTEFTYGSVYNQVTVQKEYGYSTSNVYRETRYEYENNAAYTSRHIFSLVKKVETYDGANNRLSLTEYQYDNNAVVNGTSNHGLVAATSVVQHNYTSDPYTSETIYHEGGCLQGGWNHSSCMMEGEWIWDSGCECYLICQWECTHYEEPWYESAYDPNSIFRGNVTKVTTYEDADSSPSGAISYDFTYDITGNQRTATTNCCQQTSFSYSTTTQFSQPDSVTRGSSDTQSPHRITTSASYDFNTGVMKTSTDANGRTTTVTTFDAVARPTLITGPTGAKTTIDYGDANLIGTQTVQLSSGESNIVVSKSQTTLNGRGQPVVSGYFIDATNQNQTSIKYDAMGRRKLVSMPYASGGSPSHWTEYAYDHLSRVTEVNTTDRATPTPSVQLVSKMFYNEDPAQVARPDSASTEAGQTVKSQDAWGRQRWARTDAFGRLVEVVEPNQDGNGSVASTATGSHRTEYKYDHSDQLEEIIQGSQNRKFKYDSLGRLTRQLLAEQTKTINDAGVYVGSGGSGANWSDAFEYDDRSNLEKRTDARGVVTTFSYDITTGNLDPLNRLQTISYSTSGADTTYTIHPAKTVTMEYETSGDKSRVKKVITADTSTEENMYDADGRVTEYKLTLNSRTSYPFSTNFHYDTASRLTKIEYPKQYGMTNEPRRKIEPFYDLASRLDELEVNDAVQLGEIAYNARSQVTSLDAGGTASHARREGYTYDAPTGLLTGQTVKNIAETSTFLSLSYGYARGNSKGSLDVPTGQLTSITDGLDANKNRVYEHDSLGRLIKAKGGQAAGASGVTANWTQDYSYDRYGNKTGTSKTGVAADNNAVPLDGLTSLGYNTATNRINDSGWEYDLAGNLTKGQNASGVWQRFEYDAAGRLVKVLPETGTDPIETYTYGASRERLITQTSTERRYYADGGNPLVEYKEVGSSTTPEYVKSYVYAGSRLLSTSTKASASTETTQIHHPDRLGTQLVTDPTTGASFQQSTLPFGTALGAPESTGFSNKVFTSYDRSASTGLDYAVNRTYSSGQGRFTQVDPIGMAATSADPQSLNLYAYVKNQPIDYVDPSGLIEGPPRPGCVYVYDEFGYPRGWDCPTDDLPSDPHTPIHLPIEPHPPLPPGMPPDEPGDPEPPQDRPCIDKLNAVLKILLGKDFDRLVNNTLGLTGIEALLANFLESDRIREISSGASHFDPGPRTINLNTSTYNPDNFVGALRVELIHEMLHGAGRSGRFTHEDVFSAMASVSGINFADFTANREKELKQQGAKKTDDTMYRSAMNEWIKKNCGGS